MTDPIVPVPPTPAYAAAPTVIPGKTLGIVGLILALPFIFPLLGLILSAVARSQSKAVGYKNTPATVGIIVGAVGIVLGIIVGIAIFAGTMANMNAYNSFGN